MAEIASFATEISRQDAASGGRWVHLIPAGTVYGRDGRGPYKLADADAVIRSSREFAGKTYIPMDYEHQTDLAPTNGKPAPAAGWIKGLQARADGIWGLVEWTATAAAHIANGEYRYVSPVILHTKDGTIARLLRASLTNRPNLTELKALFSTDPLHPSEKPAMDQFLSQLRQLLGLAADADEAAIATAIRELLTAKQSAAPDPSRYVPIGDFERVVSEVNSLNQGVARNTAILHVDQQVRSGNMPSYLKDWGIALCGVNKPAFDAFIERTKGSFNALTRPLIKGALPPGSQLSALTSDEQAVCTRMGLTAEEFIASKTFIEAGKA